MADEFDTLREADAELAEQPLDRAVDARLRQRLFHPPRVPSPSRRWLAWGALATVGAAAAVAAVVLFPRMPVERQGLVVARRCLVGSGAGGVDVAESCEISLPERQVEMQVRRPARLATRRTGVRLHRGEVTFDVAAQRRDDPFRIHVSNGYVQVVGTRFTIEQEEAHGSVAVTEGEVLYVDRQGVKTSVRAGGRAEWDTKDAVADDAPAESADEEPVGVEEEVPSDVSPRKRKMRPARVKPLSGRPNPTQVKSLLATVGQLRAQRRYEDAVALLDESVRRVKVDSVAVRLSFELGSLLTYQIQDASRGCAHWEQHVRRFGHGQYRDAIALAQKKLSCSP